MRDWDETFIKTVCIADTMDYITYEGLRHFRCEGKCWVYWKMGLHYLWGIETEDFGLLTPFHLSDYITYEGLRQIYPGLYVHVEI